MITDVQAALTRSEVILEVTPSIGGYMDTVAVRKEEYIMEDAGAAGSNNCVTDNSNPKGEGETTNFRLLDQW